MINKIKFIQNKITSRIRAFSMVELSVVILVTAILVAGTLSVSKTGVRNSGVKVTQDKMAEIYKAITKFVATNRRLPCPADITKISTDSGFGTEISDCTTFAPNIGVSVYTLYGCCTNINKAYGMLPVATLGLPNDMVQDGFGTKFSYIVDFRFTKASATVSSADGFEVTAATPQGSTKLNSSDPGHNMLLTTGDANSQIIDDNGLFALISHGANKLGGFNYTGKTQNPLPNSLSKEYFNVQKQTPFPQYGMTIYADYPTSSTYPFDDIILFKNKLQLVKDAGLQYIMCSTNESPIFVTSGKTLTWPTTFYNQSSVNNNGSNCSGPVSGPLSRTCGAYGQWNSVTCTS